MTRASTRSSRSRSPQNFRSPSSLNCEFVDGSFILRLETPLAQKVFKASGYAADVRKACGLPASSSESWATPCFGAQPGLHGLQRKRGALPHIRRHSRVSESLFRQRQLTKSVSAWPRAPSCHSRATQGRLFSRAYLLFAFLALFVDAVLTRRSPGSQSSAPHNRSSVSR